MPLLVLLGPDLFFFRTQQNCAKYNKMRQRRKLKFEVTSSANGSKSYRRALLRVSRRGVEVHVGVREAIREGGKFPKTKVLK